MKVVDKDFESKKKVSICLLTMDRYYMTKYAFERMMSFVDDGIEIELLVLDNGSSDERVIDYFKKIADVHIAEPVNIGVAKGLNTLLRKCTGEYICIPSNDICVGEDWLSDLIYHSDVIMNAGVCMIYRDGIKGYFQPLLSKYDTMINIWDNKDNNEGVKLFKSRLLDTIGGFDESISYYGHETNQFAQRLQAIGRYNFFIPNQNSTHLGASINDKSEYAKMKEYEYQLGRSKYEQSIKEMKKSRNYKISL